MEDGDNERKPSTAPSLEIKPASPKTKPKKEKNLSTKSKRDGAIQGTNDSSIVSKRSVERAGYDVKCSSHEWFRHFVKKPARRSPLINLGYFVRMKAIETVLDNFLLVPSPRRKLVVNLGCGYDPLPFTYLANGTSAMFVDVDYPDLIRHKQKIVEQTPAMMECVGTTWMTESSEATRESYRLIGCDLTDLPSLDEELCTLQADLQNTDILFVSEVAITYMPTKAADALIAYTSQFPYASFVILEQITPAGPTHPFARTMNNHFNKLTTPLLSLPHYPTLRSQARRFLDAGYAEIEAIDLNSFFFASMSRESRERALNTELFDEYEELNAFLCHYFVAVAQNANCSSYFGVNEGGWQYINWRKDVLLNGNMTSIEHCHRPSTAGEAWSMTRLDENKSIHRRFAASCSVGEANILIWGGLSNESRSSGLLALSAGLEAPLPVAMTVFPSPRMCHTLTPLGSGKSLLIGGRNAPKNALGDSWIYSENGWENEGWDAYHPSGGGRAMYRHAAVQIGDGKVIVHGGRGHLENLVSSDWLIYNEGQGWQNLKCDNSPSLWGACLGWNGESGILVGGVDGDGNCSGDVYSWRYDESSSTITLIQWDLSPQSYSLTKRYGAALITLNTRNILLVGGAGSHHLIPWSELFVLLSTETESVHVMDVQNETESEPWLIGHNVVYDSNTNEIVIIGGGGVCFSFGSFWNEKIFRLRQPSSRHPPQPWKLLKEAAPPKIAPILFEPANIDQSQLPRIRVVTAEQWHTILRSSKACILEGLQFGPCVTKWTPQYLKSALGPEKKVIIHKADSDAMNFLSKNFKYTTQSFTELIDSVFNLSTERVYLRAVSEDAKSKPANLKEDFPSLARDFEVPPILCGEGGIREDKVFSTVLRVGSAGSSMWLHYDVMANILTQIVGEKEILIFHPLMVNELDIPPGASSSRLPDVFATNLREKGYSAILKPGDAVYIPPLWPHATRPLTPNIGINIFWKSFKDEAYDKSKDVYGNKDLSAYSEGRRLVDRIVRGFNDLDRDTREFYLKRLAAELEGEISN